MSSIAIMKSAMRYRIAANGTTERCTNCGNHEVPLDGGHRCTRGVFYVRHITVCDEHKPTPGAAVVIGPTAA